MATVDVKRCEAAVQNKRTFLESFRHITADQRRQRGQGLKAEGRRERRLLLRYHVHTTQAHDIQNA